MTSRNRLPLNSYRASRMPTPTPKTVLMTTAIVATSAVSFSALIVSESVSALKNAEPPSEMVRESTTSTGARTRART